MEVNMITIECGWCSLESWCWVAQRWPACGHKKMHIYDDVRNRTWPCGLQRAT